MDVDTCRTQVALSWLCRVSSMRCIQEELVHAALLHQHAETRHSLQKIRNMCVTGDAADVCSVNSSVGCFACYHLILLPDRKYPKGAVTLRRAKCAVCELYHQAVTETAGRIAVTLAPMQATKQARKAYLVVWWKQHSDAVCATTCSRHCCGDSQ